MAAAPVIAAFSCAQPYPLERYAIELSLRAYWPEDALLDGRWTAPAIVPVP